MPPGVTWSSQRGDDKGGGSEGEAEDRNDELPSPRSFGRIGAPFDVPQARPQSFIELKDLALPLLGAFLLSRMFSFGGGDGDFYYYSQSESVEIVRTRNADGTVNTNVKRDSSARSNIPNLEQQGQQRGVFDFILDE